MLYTYVLLHRTYTLYLAQIQLTEGREESCARIMGSLPRQENIGYYAICQRSDIGIGGRGIMKDHQRLLNHGHSKEWPY